MRRWSRPASPPATRSSPSACRSSKPDCASAPSKPSNPIPEAVMQRFNLSQWAITHRPLVLFMIILLGAAGVYSYLNLGRAEDPNFTIKTMVVHVGCPGADAGKLQAQ